MAVYVVAAIFAAALAFGLTILLVPMVSRLAVRAKLVDLPAGRKIHSRPTPLGGGVAILLAIAMPSMLVLALARVWSGPGGAIPGWLPDAIAVHVAGVAMRADMALIILGGAGALCLMGLLDDRLHLGPWPKLVGQFAISGAVVHLADMKILTLLGEPFSTIASVMWMVVIINALNFLDNMDGLAAGITLICSAAMLAAAAGIGQLFVAGWLCLLIGAMAGFLLFNFPPARVFMGDAGSLVLGYMLAALSMLTTYYSDGVDSRMAFRLLVPLVLLAVPLYDFVSVVTIRLREKRNPMVGDTRHFSHRLVGRGMSVRAAVLTIYLCTAVTGIAAMLLPHVNDIGVLLLTAQTLGVLAIIALLESVERK